MEPFSQAEREAFYRLAVQQLRAEKYVWALSPSDRLFLRFLRIAAW